MAHMHIKISSNGPI